MATAVDSIGDGAVVERTHGEVLAVGLYRLAFRLFYGRRVHYWRCVSAVHRFISRTACPRGEVLTVGFEGSQISLPASDRSMTLALIAGNYENLIAGVLHRTLSPGSAFLDVGANVGLYTTLGSRLCGPGGSVVGVEPISETRSWLERNLAANACSNVEVLPFAAGEASGTLRMSRIQGELGTASAHENGGTFVDVPVHALDDLLPHRTFDVVKVDVEGHELAALRGMSRLLSAEDVVLILEYTGNQHAAELRRLLADSFSHLWLVDERRRRIRRIQAVDLARLRRANVIAARRALPVFDAASGTAPLAMSGSADL